MMQQIKISFSETRRSNNASRCFSSLDNRKSKKVKQSMHMLKKSEPLNRLLNPSLKLPKLNPTPSLSHKSKKSDRSKLASLDIPVSLNPEKLLVIKEQKPSISSDLKQKLLSLNTTQNNLQEVTEIGNKLQESSSFFAKLDEVIICCLLRCSVIKLYKRRSYIYSKGDLSRQFYVIIDGTVKLSCKKQQFRKICKPGQTISEEVLFNDNKDVEDYKIEFAKAITPVILLQVTQSVYFKICDELNRTGKRHLIKVLEALILRNYLTKKTIRKQRFC